MEGGVPCLHYMYNASNRSRQADRDIGRWQFAIKGHYGTDGSKAFYNVQYAHDDSARDITADWDRWF